MSAARIDTAALLARTNLAEIVERFIPVKPAGAEFQALCPFHADSRPSLRIIPAKGFCFCHACHWWGDAIDFVMEFTGQSFREAVATLDSGAVPEHVQQTSRSAAKLLNDPWVPVIPVPATAPPMDFTDLWNPNRERTSAFRQAEVFPYHSLTGELCGYVLRVEFPDGKITPQVTYCTNTDTGEQHWCLKAMPKPRSLYGLENLPARPDAKILIVEGERCKNVGQKVFGGMVVVSWAGGTGGAKHTDWTPLTGRDVVLWPDNDEPGLAVMAEIAVELAPIAASLRIVTPPGTDKPTGWDIADAILRDQATPEAVRAWARERIQPWVPPAVPRETEGAAPPADREIGHMESDGSAYPPPPAPLDDPSSAEDPSSANPSPTVPTAESEESTAAQDQAQNNEPQDRGSTVPPKRPRPRVVVDNTTDGNTIRKPKPPPLSPLSAASMSWDELGLDRAPGKVPHCNLDNVTRTLERHPELAGHIWYDEFLQRIISDFGGITEEWKETNEIALAIWFQRVMAMPKMAETTVARAVQAYARRNIKNECKAYIQSNQWDGLDRLSFLMSEGFGAVHSPYTAAVGRCFIVGMVARAMNPGCKADNMPILEGGQGVFKSSALSIIGGKWFTECHESVNDKDFYQVMRGKLLIEIAELHSFSRYDIKRVKGVISCKVDNYRESYGRYATDHPRQGVFAGSTNEKDWNEDETGARRFWPIECGEVNLEWIAFNRDQLFAQALHLYNLVPVDAPKNERIAAGAAWWDVPKEEAEVEQDKRLKPDEWEALIRKYIIADPERGSSGNLIWTKRPAELTTMSVSEILEKPLQIQPGKWNRGDQMRVSGILKHRLKWTRERDNDGHGWHYEAPAVTGDMQPTAGARTDLL